MAASRSFSSSLCRRSSSLRTSYSIAALSCSNVRAMKGLLVHADRAMNRDTIASRDRPRKRNVADVFRRSEEHTSELQSLMRISYAVFCLKKKNTHTKEHKILVIYIQSIYTDKHLTAVSQSVIQTLK